MLKVTKPAAQYRVQVLDNHSQALPSGSSGPRPNAVAKGLKTLSSNPALAGLKTVTQKLKPLPFNRAVPYMGLVGIQAQSVFLHPAALHTSAKAD